MDDIARARAILGVAPGVTADELRRRYKALVRQWHPDRYAGDAAGEAEAAVRMRQINDAYRRLLAHIVPAASPASRPGARSHTAPGRRLSREEIDRLVASIGTKGPIDDFLDLTRSAGRGYAMSGVSAMLFAIALVITLGRSGDLRADLVILAAIVGALGFLMWRRRTRKGSHES